MVVDSHQQHACYYADLCRILTRLYPPQFSRRSQAWVGGYDFPDTSPSTQGDPQSSAAVRLANVAQLCASLRLCASTACLHLNFRDLVNSSPHSSASVRSDFGKAGFEGSGALALLRSKLRSWRHRSRLGGSRGYHLYKFRVLLSCII